MDHYMIYIQGGATTKGGCLCCLTDEDMADIERVKLRLPDLPKMVYPYYDENYFQNGVIGKAILVQGGESQEVRDYLSEHFYDGGRVPGVSSSTPGRRVRKHFSENLLVFPRYFNPECALLPIECVSNGVVGNEACYVETDDPVIYALISSKMFFAWLSTSDWRSPVAIMDLKTYSSSFPGPAKGYIPDGLKSCVEELRECHAEAMQVVRETGGDYWSMVPEKAWKVLERLNRCVDAMYPDYHPGVDRAEFLLKLTRQKNFEERQRFSYPFHPQVNQRQIPILLVLLHSNEPLSPAEIAERAGMYRDECTGPLSGMVKGKKDGSGRVVRAIGKVGKKRYESSVDYEEFFRKWVRCWLPADQQEWSAVWTSAKDFTRETAFLMPDQYEFRTYLELLHIGPVTSKVLFAKAGSGRLADKNLIRRNVSGLWEAVWTESEVRAGALRKIFFSMRPELIRKFEREFLYQIPAE